MDSHSSSRVRAARSWSSERNLAATISRLIYRVTLTSCHSVSLVVGRFCRGLILPSPSCRSHPKAQSRPLDRYLNDHFLRPREDNPGSFFQGSTYNDCLDPCALGWSLLRANDSELTCAIVTLPRVPATLWPRDSRDALRNVDCHSPRRGRNVSHIQRERNLKRTPRAFVRRNVYRRIAMKFSPRRS